MYLLLLLPPFLVVLSKNYIHRSLFIRLFEFSLLLSIARSPNRHCPMPYSHTHTHTDISGSKRIVEERNGSFPCRETKFRAPSGIGVMNRMHSECAMREAFVRNVCFEIDCHVAIGVVNGRIWFWEICRARTARKNNTEKQNTHRSALTEVSAFIAIFTLCWNRSKMPLAKPSFRSCW